MSLSVIFSARESINNDTQADPSESNERFNLNISTCSNIQQPAMVLSVTIDTTIAVTNKKK